MDHKLNHANYISYLLSPIYGEGFNENSEEYELALEHYGMDGEYATYYQAFLKTYNTSYRVIDNRIKKC